MITIIVYWGYTGVALVRGFRAGNRLISIWDIGLI